MRRRRLKTLNEQRSILGENSINVSKRDTLADIWRQAVAPWAQFVAQEVARQQNVKIIEDAKVFKDPKNIIEAGFRVGHSRKENFFVFLTIPLNQGGIRLQLWDDLGTGQIHQTSRPVMSITDSPADAAASVIREMESFRKKLDRVTHNRALGRASL